MTNTDEWVFLDDKDNPFINKRFSTFDFKKRK